MKPYYQDSAVTIYHGDCMEIAPKIIAPDALISDPPYGINYNHSGQHGRFGKVGVTKASKLRGNYPIAGDSKPFDPAPWIEQYENVLLRGADHFYPRLPDSGRMLAWNKLGDMEPWDSFSDVEFAWHSLKGAARIFSMKWKGIACDKAGENNGLREHPTQKPLRLMMWCIDQCKLPAASLILDPYMGSGTTLRAAKDMGHHAIGIDLEEKYCEIAARRMGQEVLPLEAA